MTTRESDIGDGRRDGDDGRDDGGPVAPLGVDAPQPTRDAHGLPLCALDDCRQFDGKRCRLTGFRPDRFCEPALIEERAAPSKDGGA